MPIVIRQKNKYVTVETGGASTTDDVTTTENILGVSAGNTLTSALNELASASKGRLRGSAIVEDVPVTNNVVNSPQDQDFLALDKTNFDSGFVKINSADFAVGAEHSAIKFDAISNNWIAFALSSVFSNRNEQKVFFTNVTTYEIDNPALQESDFEVWIGDETNGYTHSTDGVFISNEGGKTIFNFGSDPISGYIAFTL